MPTPQREPLRAITPAQQAGLQRIVSASSERVDQVRRAAAILAVAQGSPFIHAARLAGLRSGTTVADLVIRFNRHGLAALDIAAGRGRRPTYVPSARARIAPLYWRPKSTSCAAGLRLSPALQTSTVPPTFPFDRRHARGHPRRAESGARVWAGTLERFG